MLPSDESAALPTKLEADRFAGMTTLHYQLTRADYKRLSHMVRRRLPASLRWSWHAFSVVLWLLLASVFLAYLRVRDLLEAWLGEVPSGWAGAR